MLRKLKILSLILTIAPVGGFCQSLFWKTIGDYGSLEDYSSDMIFLSSGDLAVCGNRAGVTGNDSWIYRADTSGNLIWFSTLDSASLTIADYLQTIFQTQDGGIVAAGNAGNVPVMIKTDAGGNLLWKRGFRPVGPLSGTYLNYIRETTGGNLIAIGRADHDIILIKTDPAGGVIVYKRISLPGNVTSVSAITGPGQKILISGSYRPASADTGFIMLADTMLAPVWSYQISGVSRFENAVPAGGNNYLLAGYTVSPVSSGSDIILMKVDLLGNMIWTKQMGHPGMSDVIKGFEADGGNGVYITGGNWSASPPYYPGFIVRADSTGDTLWTLQSTEICLAGTILPASGDVFYMTGHVFPAATPDTAFDSYILRGSSAGEACQFVPGKDWVLSSPFTALFPLTWTETALADSLTSAGPYTSSSATVNEKCMGVITKAEKPPVQWIPVVYPNPSPGVFHIGMEDGEGFGTAEACVTDLQGRILVQFSLHTGTSEHIDLSGHPDGLYLLRVYNEEHTTAIKLLKQ